MIDNTKDINGQGFNVLRIQLGLDESFTKSASEDGSIEELEKLAKLLDGKHVKKEMWIGVARPIKELADEKGYIKTIEDAGAKIACDTCHVVAPLKGRFKTIATNSAKGVFYGRGKNDFKTKFATVPELIEEATK